MIADSFESRTLANMEVALERACKLLSTGAEKQHWARRHIASKIVECAEGGDKTLKGMTEAGRAPQRANSVQHSASDTRFPHKSEPHAASQE